MTFQLQECNQISHVRDHTVHRLTEPPQALADLRHALLQLRHAGT